MPFLCRSERGFSIIVSDIIDDYTGKTKFYFVTAALSFFWIYPIDIYGLNAI